MPETNITADALSSTRAYLTEQGDTGPADDQPVSATLLSGLRCHVGDDAHGSFTTDMPTRIGGSGAGPSPGHFFRGAIAACMATALAMRAADSDVEIEALTVTARSTSDNFAFFGLTDGDVQFCDVHIEVEISAPAATSTELEALVEYARSHAPVGLSLEHPIPTMVSWNRTG